ncbi:AAA family ATPase [Dongshaea marina]|uniref:AAA family ATPase n=1 Tax=Dongshaea marina TaxID=2047966 RepID=UPI00131EE363|nr:AAA family ATPase [Dongshaea marina]
MNSTEHTLLAERIHQLIKQLSAGLYERVDAMRLSLLAALAGESVFLLGPPGIAKSMLARRLISAFESGNSFEYLMTRFSTPEEVFGPLSIKALKDQGSYLRLTQGYLPEADVVFLDEIWKASPAILNTLLTVINEKTFKNGQQISKVPMKLLISASNELPEQDASLDALYDRLLLRLYLGRIREKGNFQAMITAEGHNSHQIDPGLKISDKEYQYWQSQIDHVQFPTECFEKLFSLKESLELMALESDDEQTKRSLYISDRRWKKSVRLLKTSALFNGRNSIDASDLLLLRDCLWRDLAGRQVIYQLFEEFSAQSAFDQDQLIGKTSQLKQQLSKLRKRLREEFSSSFSFEEQGRLRKKNSYSFPFHQARRFQFQGKQDLLKLVFLETNEALTEHPMEPGQWAYVPARLFARRIKSGQCELTGYLNGRKKPQMLRFAIEGKQLVGKDIANHGIRAAIVCDPAPEPGLLKQLRQELSELNQQTAPLERELKQLLQRFTQGSHNHFVPSSLLDRAESSFSELTVTLGDIQHQLEHVSPLMDNLNQLWPE